MTSPPEVDAWHEALRVLEKDGDTRLLGALLWQATSDGKGVTPIPTDVIYALAQLLTPKDWRERIKLVKKPISRRAQVTAMRHERSVIKMIEILRTTTCTVEDAAEKVAKNLEISESTVLHAWSEARSLLPSLIEAFVSNPSRKND
jgi:hypothetical protein